MCSDLNCFFQVSDVAHGPLVDFKTRLKQNAWLSVLKICILHIMLLLKNKEQLLLFLQYVQKLAYSCEWSYQLFLPKPGLRKEDFKRACS